MNTSTETSNIETDNVSKPSVMNKDNFKKVLSFGAFALLAMYLAYISPTITIAWVVAILVLTIYLFVFEIVDIDVAAISIMVLLGLSSLLAPVMGLEQGSS